jgi:hypothetical protein
MTCLEFAFWRGDSRNDFTGIERGFQPPSQRFAPIGDTPLYKKQLGVFVQIFNILRKKGDINFKLGGIV